MDRGRREEEEGEGQMMGPYEPNEACQELSFHNIFCKINHFSNFLKKFEVHVLKTFNIVLNIQDMTLHGVCEKTTLHFISSKRN